MAFPKRDLHPARYHYNVVLHKCGLLEKWDTLVAGPLSVPEAVCVPVCPTGGRLPGRHGEGVPSADLPPQPSLPVEEAGAAEEEAPGLVSESLWTPYFGVVRTLWHF